MKLQILIPQYKEDEKIIRPLLDSIEIQQNVDLEHEIGAIIVNDGSDVLLSAEFLNRYTFPIQYVIAPHLGVSAARNIALEQATADYVTYCDADDMYYNACGLWIIFREIALGEFDGLRSVFIEEIHRADGEVLYINRENDSTFVHGKVWRRQYLIENNIRWNNDLKIHEDSFFNGLALNLSKNIKDCPYPFYLWRWRDDSVCRHDPKYMLKTFSDFISSNDALVGEYLLRGKGEEAMNVCALMVLTSYYTMNKPEWIDQENWLYRANTERRFAEYYRKYKALWDKLDPKMRMRISNSVRTQVIREGMEMEHETIDAWLRKVEALE